MRALRFEISILKERNTETVSETLALTEEQEEDGLRPGQEVVTFKHVCGACGHLVALHRHDFWVEADYQVMSTILGPDTVQSQPLTIFVI